MRDMKKVMNGKDQETASFISTSSPRLSLCLSFTKQL
jgi:hypothetical protein